MGVHPLLELSHYQVKFAATSLYDTSVATLYVINSRLSMNSPTPSVPRIGLEDASPVGPTSFEFLLPPDSPITISPSVGTVWPGKVGVGPTGGPGRGQPRGPVSTLPGPQRFNQTADVEINLDSYQTQAGHGALRQPNLAPEAGHPRAADPMGPWLEGGCAALGSHSRWAQRPHSAWSPGAQGACPPADWRKVSPPLLLLIKQKEPGPGGRDSLS